MYSFCALQMFGAYVYGFVDRDDVKTDLRICKLADRMDQNDYMYSNSPYSITYERPARRSPVVVHSDSPRSPELTLNSPEDEVVEVVRLTENVGPQMSTDPGISGINQYGTNTLQIRAMVFSEHAAAEVPPQTTRAGLQGCQQAEQSQVVDVDSDREIDVPEDQDLAMETDNDSNAEEQEDYQAVPDNLFHQQEQHHDDVDEELVLQHAKEHQEGDVEQGEEHQEGDHEQGEEHQEGDLQEGADHHGADCEGELQHQGAVQHHQGEDQEHEAPDAEHLQVEVPQVEEHQGGLHEGTEHGGEEHREEEEVTITREVTSPKPAPGLVIELSDDDEFDKPHSSDDDDEDENNPTQTEMKVLELPGGKRMKVEKDYWKKHEEKRQRRIARAKEKEEKERQQAEDRESARIAREQIALIQRQMQLLMDRAGPTDLSFEGSSSIAPQIPHLPVTPLVAHVPPPPPAECLDRRVDDTAETSLPLPEHLNRRLDDSRPEMDLPQAKSLDRRPDDSSIPLPSAYPVRTAATPVSEEARLPTRDDSGINLRVVLPVEEATPSAPDRRDDDSIVEEIVDSLSRDLVEKAYDEVTKEERVDYEPGPEDLDPDSTIGPSQSEDPDQNQDQANQVQTSDPYGFD